MQPYAVYLLERFRAGETAEDLAASEGIPLDRIQIRLDAAMEFERTREAAVSAGTRAAKPRRLATAAVAVGLDQSGNFGFLTEDSSKS